MYFKLNQLKTFLQRIQNNQIEELDIQSHNFTITINKNIHSSLYGLSNSIIRQDNPTLTHKQEYNHINFSNNQNKTNGHKLDQSSKTLTESENYSTVVSPMVGTFYRAPGPNEPAFIQKNDLVEKKQTVCIIEAMKLMNEIEAEVNGEVVDILVKDGDIVDCGQALIKVKKLDS